LFTERGQYRWEGFDEGDADFASKFWIPGFEVILRFQCKCEKTIMYGKVDYLEEIVQLAAKLVTQIQDAWLAYSISKAP